MTLPERAGVSRPALPPALIIAAAAGALTIALWLLPASVHIVEWPRSGPHRIAVLAPLYHFFWLAAGLSLVTAALVAIATRTGRLERLAYVCAPLNVLWAWTLPYWPWLPDWMPLLVALAGPLRWTFAVVALIGVSVRLGPRFGPWPLPGRTTAFVLAFVTYAAFGLHARAVVGLSGDEPHYLVITHSLLVDHDLRIENNHASRDYRSFFAADLRPDYLQRGVNGEIYSIHAPGLSALILPGYALAGADGAVLTMCLLAALTALAVFDAAARVSTPSVAWLTWLATCITVPFIPHAWAIYPEMAGAAIVAWAVSWSLETRVRARQTWLWRGCCLALLPWLHTKFSVLVTGLTVLFLWQLRNRWRAGVALLLPIGVSLIVWLAFFKIVYGTFDPQAPYGAYTAQFVRLENVPRSLLGLLFDPKFGLLVYAPIYALAVSGAWLLARDGRWQATVVASLALTAAYTLSSARLYMWWGGSSAPARFLVPVVPLLAPMVAAGVMNTRSLAARATWELLGAVSLTIGLGGAFGTDRLMLFSEPHGFARMLEAIEGSAPLAAAFPTFTEENWLTPALRLATWGAAAGLAIGAGLVIARFARRAFWIVFAEILTFAVAASAFATTASGEARIGARTRGVLDLLERFDPQRARAFDYANMTRLSPQAWLGALTLTFDRQPDAEPDPIGRVTSPLRLPPGRYNARVWFDGERIQRGAYQAAIGNGYQLARTAEPLANPTELDIDLPIGVPLMWMQLTDRDAAAAMRRLEIAARYVDPSGDRPEGTVRSVEGFDDRPHAYVAYMDENTFPERGVFWTKDTARGRLLLAPAGAGTAVVTVHVGPRPATVSLVVGSKPVELAMSPEETTTVRVALPAGERIVPIEVQSSSSFRPALVDPASSDSRQLGCQVRVVLE